MGTRLPARKTRGRVRVAILEQNSNSPPIDPRPVYPRPGDPRAGPTRPARLPGLDPTRIILY